MKAVPAFLLPAVVLVMVSTCACALAGRADVACAAGGADSGAAASGSVSAWSGATPASGNPRAGADAFAGRPWRRAELHEASRAFADIAAGPGESWVLSIRGADGGRGVPPARLELEYGSFARPVHPGSRFAATDRADDGVRTILANVYHDFRGGAFTPYVGAGVGLALVGPGARSDLEALGVVDSSLMEDGRGFFAGQVGFGWTCSFGGAALDFGYRCLMTENAGSQGPGLRPAEKNYSAHQLMLGARMKF